MKISVLTLGCKVNQAESSVIEGALKISGHEIVGLSQKPEICIINTCTVTSKSDYQSRQLIRRAQRVGARVIVTGCYSELNKESVRSMEGVKEIVDNGNKMNIVDMLTGQTLDFTSGLPSDSRSRLFVKIQDGCNYSCSYCTIPRARGGSRSLSPEDVVQQVKWAAAAGYNEVVLTGIHLGTYGLDLLNKVTLSDIVRTLLKETKIRRIRISSLEANEINDRLLELMHESRICSHLHIPLQSGDDTILKLMNRTYDSRQFSMKIEHILNRAPGAAIGTDVIIGFPGEGNEEFQNTYKLLEGLPVSYMHIFPFSPRPGTRASNMPDHIPPTIKKERMHVMDILNTGKKSEYMKKQIGQTLDVLIEECTDRTCIGTSGNYLKIEMPSNNHSRGSLVTVNIKEIRDGRLIGTPI